MNAPRIGYVPYSPPLERPGDRRRFVYYARSRNLDFEIADPAKEYDLVVLSECADLSVWSRYPHGKLVYDLIDSYLAIPYSNIKGLLRGTAKFLARQSRYPQLNHWQAIVGMCRRASAVVCSTLEQQQDIGRYNPNVHIVLDIHTSVVQHTKRDYSAHRPFRLVWEGLPHTLDSLFQIQPALQTLHERHGVELHLVTDLEFRRYMGLFGKTDTLSVVRKLLPGVRLHPWREKDCADIICDCDAALIPIRLDDPFAAGKPENKLLLLWRMGMPVLVSATPAYARAMAASGVHGTCAGQDEWLQAIERLIGDQAARQEAGLRGRVYAEDTAGESQLLARWDQVFSSIGFEFARGGTP